MNQPEKSHLTLWMGGAIAIGVALVLPHFAMKLHVGGEVFLRLLKMMVVPLVVVTVMSGILGLGDVRKLGRPGGSAILYYLTTTVLAAVLGLILVNIIQPGIGTVDEATLDQISDTREVQSSRMNVLDALAEVTGLAEEEIASVLEDPSSDEQETPTVSTILINLILMLFTDNLIASAVQTNLLPLIVFSIIFAGVLTTMGERVAALTSMIEQVNNALIALILLLMKVALWESSVSWQRVSARLKRRGSFWRCSVKRVGMS